MHGGDQARGEGGGRGRCPVSQDHAAACAWGAAGDHGGGQVRAEHFAQAQFVFANFFSISFIFAKYSPKNRWRELVRGVRQEVASCSREVADTIRYVNLPL